jgi:hypothetical protein
MGKGLELDWTFGDGPPSDVSNAFLGEPSRPLRDEVQTETLLRVTASHSWDV